VQTLAVHCHCDVCSAAVGHSAGCRTSWVCLQHHATVVTSNGVTVCGSKFPSTVTKHCQHQHRAIPKTIQQCEIPTIPAAVISNVLLPQSSIMAALFIATEISSQMSLQLCQHTTNIMSHNIQFYSVGHFQLMPSDSCQNVHLAKYSSKFNLTMTHLNVMINIFN